MSVRASKLVALGLLVSASLIGCQLIGGYEEFSGSGGGTAADCGMAPALGGSTMVAQPRSGGGCFWIDSTEVTAEQYAAFVGAADPPSKVAPCENNLGFKPDADCVAMAGAAATGSQPVVCIDWCDADSYCTFVGKRLCRGDFLASNAADKSEWYAACSNDGTRLYPYGTNYDATACNGGCTAGCAVVDAGSLTSCATESGARDLSGNVAEWADECNGTQCVARGGGATSGATALSCEAGAKQDRLATAPFLGFRCCADALE